MEQYFSIILMVAVIGLMYVMMIRPENKRKKQAEEMRNSLKKGDKITTIGGLKGKVVAINDDTVVFETSEDRVRMEITKWAVSSNDSQQPEDKKSKKTEDSEQMEAGADK